MTAPTLAVERTALSWRRTAVAAMGTAALFINHSAMNGWRGSAIAPFCAAVALGALALIAFRRNRVLLHDENADSDTVGTHSGRGQSPEFEGAPDIVMTTVVIIGVAVIAAIVGFADPGA
ncbi:DUF202 domain-containing protein [Nocardia jejuensis]|uniref:DUF202 domain-containing protein n=1 Tax=Nocardia jejuensis TaxID=328049 RepID=UPI00082C4393|nr:DUF202 domain-containing protein [Nocardia jejuensis]